MPVSINGSATAKWAEPTTIRFSRAMMARLRYQAEKEDTNISTIVRKYALQGLNRAQGADFKNFGEDNGQ